MSSANTSASRRATRLSFLVAGFGLACWAPMIPFAKERLQVDAATLGLLLLCLGVGSVVAMTRTGPLCARHGSKPVILAGGWGMVLLLPALALASTPIALALALLGFGAALGSLDAAMNVHAVEVERAAQRPMMSGFHALFSVGGFVGASLMTFLISQTLGLLASTLLCAALMAVGMVLAAPGLIVAEAPATGDHGTLIALPRGPVLLLALLACITFLVEGSLLDWSALLLVETGMSSAEQAGLGYALFAVAMTLGRFGGDAITARLGDQKVMLWGSVLAVLGFVVLLLAPWAWVAVSGFAWIGLGVSNVVPVLFRKAGAQTVMPAAMAVSVVTLVGYAGQLAGPAVLGFVAKATSLPGAFWLLAALVTVLPLCTRRVCDKD